MLTKVQTNSNHGISAASKMNQKIDSQHLSSIFMQVDTTPKTLLKIVIVGT